MTSDFERYSRQMVLPEVGAEGQARLKRARVVVVGAGGLGSPILTYLAAAGVGELCVVDGDRVETSNLHRQPIYGDDDVGELKVDCVARKLSALNGSSRVQKFGNHISVSNVREICSGAQVLVDGTDNFAAKYLLNDASVELGIPLVFGAVFQFEGQVSVFNAPLPEGQHGPSYRCLYPEPPTTDLIPSCAQAGVLGVLPGLIGILQATEALKLLLTGKTSLAGRMLVYDALSMEFSDFRFSPNYARISETRIKEASYYEALLGTCAGREEEIGVSELRSSLARNEIVHLIDVREAEEHRDHNLGGKVIPLSEIDSRIGEIPRSGLVVLYCKSGMRSSAVLKRLRSEYRFANVKSLRGGLMAWESATG